MKVLVDADMIAHEVGHLRYNEKDENGKDLIDPDTGRVVKGELFPLDLVKDIAKGRFLSIIMGAQAGGWKGFLTKGRHFRHDLATILPYKGHREGAERNNVDHVKQHLADALDCEWHRDQEADDAMAIEQWKDLVSVASEQAACEHNDDGPEEWDDSTLRSYTNTVIASRDKDLDTVPGWKFKWWLKGAKDKDGVEIPEEQRTVEKGEVYWVSVIQAFRNFYTQMLTGDIADNIKGLYNVGPKSAWVKQVQDMNSEEEMYDHVEDKYRKYYGDWAERALKENAALLHMHRRKNDEWLPPHERDEDYWKL